MNLTEHTVSAGFNGSYTVDYLRRNEETLYWQARPVLGIHLLLRQNPRVRTVGGRDATVFPGFSAFVHQMILTLESRGLVERVSGQARSIRLLIRREELPDLV